MRALILERPGCVTLRETRVPDPGPGEVLLRVRAATTCGTDLKAYLRGHPQIPMPGTFGHEYSGEVVSVGKGVAFKSGEGVMGVHSAPCKQCRWCRKGQENLCESIMATKALGSYAEYLLIPARVAAHHLFHKPEGVSFARASLLEPLACVIQGLSMLRIRPEDRILVIGPGAIGLMFVAALRHMGVGEVTLAGRNARRLEIGERLGARVAKYDPKDRTLREFDYVVECTGAVEVWERALDFVVRGGTAMLFGGCRVGTTACFDTRKVHYDQVTILSPFHFGTDAVLRAREWLLDPAFDLGPLISGRRSLEDGPKVFEELRQGLGVKYVFEP